MQCILAVDIGTSSIKAGLVGFNGTIYKEARLFFSKNVSAGEWVSTFENIFKSMIDFIMSSTSSDTNKLSMCGICISGNGPSLVAVLENTPHRLLLWNKPHNLKNVKSTSSIFLPRILAFKELYPEDFYNAKYIISGPEYLIYRLTGNAVTILPDSRYEKAYWTDELLEEFDINKKFPPFVESGAQVGFYRDIPVFAGAPDFVSALVGTGTVSVGKACDRAGSSEGFNVCIDKESIKPLNGNFQNLRLLPSIIPNLWNISYLIPDSGKQFFNYIQKINKNFLDFNTVMHEINSIEISKIQAYSNFEFGEGKKLIENIGFEIRRGLDLLEEYAGFQPEYYVIAGGQAENEIWCQMKADITGRTFVVAQTPNAELIGNTILACKTLGVFESIESASQKIVQYKKSYKPNTTRYRLYSNMYSAKKDRGE